MQGSELSRARAGRFGSGRQWRGAPDEGSAVDTAIPPVEIWLLDHNGKRMGARPEAEHPAPPPQMPA